MFFVILVHVKKVDVMHVSILFWFT